MQQHGFARNLDWELASTSANPNPDDAEPTVRARGCMCARVDVRARAAVCAWLAGAWPATAPGAPHTAGLRARAAPPHMHARTHAVTQVEMVLTESPYTLAMWPFKFKAVYTVALAGEVLRTHLRVINTDAKPFEFTAALHSYFEVLHINKAKVMGLKGGWGAAARVCVWGGGARRSQAWAHAAHPAQHAKGQAGRGCTAAALPAPALHAPPP